MSRSVVFSTLLSGVFFLSSLSFAIPTSLEFQTATLPMTCAELLPDTTPYVLFFEAVGRGQVVSDKRFSKRIYRILALRDRLIDLQERGKDQNPIDMLIRKSLCFYREQKEPIKPITYDDAQFLSYMRSSLSDLEVKVDQSVYDWEFERQQRKEFERKALKNQRVVDTLIREADVEADQQFEKISRRAKKKAMTP